MPLYAYDQRPLPPGDPAPLPPPAAAGPKSFHRRSSLALFIGITTLSLAALMGALMVKPNFYLKTKADVNGSKLRQIQNLIADCRLTFDNCGQAPSQASIYIDPQVQISLLNLGTRYRLNPQVIVAVNYLLYHSPAAPAQTLEQQFEALRTIIDTHPYTAVPSVHEHAVHGYSQTNGLSLAAYHLVLYLADQTGDPLVFTDAVSPPVDNDNEILGFVEVFETLYRQNPRLSQP